MITSLEENEVFVFGSNNQGFHGSGAAAMAFRYRQDLDWRNEEFFLKAMKSSIPEDRIGKWTVFGVGRGFAEGREGKSYAIATVDFDPRTRKRTKVSLRDIGAQIEELIEFAYNNPQYVFLVTKFGTGLAGYREKDIQDIWDGHSIPENIRFV